MQNKLFEDIPGTTMFDGEMARLGYHFNMFFMSLMRAENRAAFKADEAGFMQRFPLSAEQKKAVLARDWNAMTALGGNVFFMVKLVGTDGLPVAAMCAAMTGMSPDEYQKMMLDGGRPAEGNRSKGAH
ncbi:MAG TPA: protocatechuate 4,5-dioxygenase subunit alpha [Burkholderiales bacterium]|jgi:protocatechuate 4,5-dioxygenase alpha chain|nr:protocatechuate 4,5-dioxygenase subunit alpha [Burkholderiales bacterium]